MSSSVDILVPNLPESVTDATVAVWHKKSGDNIQQDDILLEIETDKIMLEVPAPNTGVLISILAPEGSIVISGQILGKIELTYDIPAEKDNAHTISKHQQASFMSIASKNIFTTNQDNEFHNVCSPSVRKLIAEHDLKNINIQGSGTKGRITHKDVEAHIIPPKQTLQESTQKTFENIQTNTKIQKSCDNRTTTRVTMNRLRQKIAERLVAVTNNTAMLTTFNEVNMQPIITIKNKYKELFQKNYGIKLGFMSFYVKAVLEGLRNFPEINASIDGEEIVYYNYFDINIAVSTPRGLITPVLRNVDTLSIADIEKDIKSLAEKGRNGKLTLEELSGGNFTITNGGVFGSLISTPIINPPQSAILGMHAIKDRPVSSNGQVVVLPMMYLALSYDHRLIDGKDSVRFLVYIKELLEDPIRLLLKI
ncbi:2-oxoglutarate dehydrogenase complex dihydrolipoyllysine-residue succinyltransferase [Candidatus Blochmannia ocreatus (nom. nud.)]|uniref:Dihydrolipoyllysine-residue succinyltransferase component of 2-oxoglutarate dehydrogenase complex n=1 Tax=Candidatus Blochmannia ocreatus (nom. nud.) TaxID=251538 RepID=A0ABY4SZL6_9ENTR|nr:2-oxoglutarate dehydrogenase complex dihydrolipoyllysine-residue succinyltransferase [Candidatus Blochmannia ocreatus]URJ25392.1 2-oxoglutarate dehydrogenase complex dihydrolipoyllysine-residue succinyltransferase [Candidatus Blochmannia ocreatus]